MFNWTDIVIAFIGLVAAILSGMLAYVWNKHLKPWLEERGLMEAAEMVVYAAEAALGRFKGEEKMKLAIQKMNDMGYNIDSQEVLDALNAAWQKMNIAQIASGEKRP